MLNRRYSVTYEEIFCYVGNFFVCSLCCCSSAIGLSFNENLKNGVVGEEYYDGKPLASSSSVVLTINKSIIRISGTYGEVEWAIIDGTLPDGLSYSTPKYKITTRYYCPMLIKGIPTRAGEFTFTVKAVKMSYGLASETAT